MELRLLALCGFCNGLLKEELAHLGSERVFMRSAAAGDRRLARNVRQRAVGGS